MFVGGSTIVSRALFLRKVGDVTAFGASVTCVANDSGHRSSLGDDSSSLIHPACQALDCSAVLFSPSLSATTPSSCVSSAAAKVGTRINVFGERAIALRPGIQCVYKHPLLISFWFSCGTESCFDRSLPSR